MASIAQPMSWLTQNRARRYGKLVLGGLLTAIIGGFFAALFTYYATVRINTNSALQQQYLAAVQEFTATGSKIDASVTDLADAVADAGKASELSDARKEVRQAIAAHAAATQSLQQVVGKGNIEAYLTGLGTLRTLIDDTNNAKAVVRASQARFDLMHNRTLMVAEARRRIYG
jgi:hypothetical protein